MATRYAGITAASGAPKMLRSQVVFAASGGTLTGSQSVQIVFDDTVYGSGAEGKQRLLAALRLIADAVKTARVWPLAVGS